MKEFLDPQSAEPRLSLSRVLGLVNKIAAQSSGGAYWDIISINAAHKLRFIRSIVDCIARGDETIFGPPDKVLAHYQVSTDF